MGRVEDLYELIGILDSINYDEVINEKEIDSLNLWINNHEYVHDKQLIDIINIIKEIIKDGIVNEDEKKRIVDLVKKFYKENMTESERLSCLNGIIDGIVSDNVVNIKEIKKLQFWILSNTELASNILYQRVFYLLKKININDLDEEEVLDDFRKLAFDNFVTNKTQSLKYKISNNILIGNDLIKLIGEKDMIDKIHKSAMIQINNILSHKVSFIEADLDIVIISLSLIALLYYNSSYWDHVRDVYNELYDKYSEQRIEHKLREIIYKYNNGKNDEQWLINYVLENAIVPMYYLPSFFDFIYDIYKYNFECNISDKNLDEEFEFIYDGLKSLLSSGIENNDVEINVTRKSYRLIKCTKNVIIGNETIHNIIELSENILKIIDEYYWNNKNICGNNIYYNYGFDNWLKTINIDYEKNVNKEKKNRFTSSWKPEFQLEGNNVYLVPPNHKIKNTYNYQYINVVVTCDGEKIYENNRPDIYDMFGGYKIIVNRIKLDNPLGNIRYIVYCNNEIIYDSGENLFRDYIIFKSNGQEYKNNTDYNGQIDILHKNKDDNYDHVYYENDYYCLSTKNVNAGDTFFINGNLINFSTKLECGLVGSKLDSYLLKDVEYPIYSSLEKYIIETTENLNNIGIMINDKRNKLSDLDYQLKSRGGYNDYIIDLDLTSNSIYSIYAFKINSGEEISKSRTNLALVDNLEFDCNQLDNNNYAINVSSSLFDQEISEVLNIKEKDELYISSFIDSQEYKLFLKLNIKLFKLDNNGWMTFDDYIWVKDVSNYSKLYTYGIDSDYIIVKGNKSVSIQTLYNRQKNNPIGMYEFGSSVANNFEDESLKIIFFKDNKIIDNISCYCKTVLANPQSLYSFDSINGTLKITPKLYGKGIITLKIYDGDNNIYYQDITKPNEVIEINELKSFTEYKIQLIEQAEEFSFDEDRILYSRIDSFYCLKDLKGRYFKLDKAKISKIIGGVFQYRNFILWNTFVSFKEQIDETTYEGEIYYFTGENKYVFKTCNPVEIELVSDPIDDVIEVSITCEGDGLLINFDKRTILDKDDPRATDIYSYEMNLKKGGKEWQN